MELAGQGVEPGVLEIGITHPMLEELRMAALGKKRRVVAELQRVQSEGTSMVDLNSPRFQAVIEGEVN